MPKFILQAVASLLVPCLLADPATSHAISLNSPLPPKAYSIGFLFTMQVLQEELVVSEKRPVTQIRLSPQVQRLTVAQDGDRQGIIQGFDATAPEIRTHVRMLDRRQLFWLSAEVA